ncbi:caspase family protein [Streptomyces sp. NPDC057740]|uniref:caspase family protein n=1 Tax=Streptomyces sp. NPDC057740 TaxID=3346234 RepID=UPI0036991D8B
MSGRHDDGTTTAPGRRFLIAVGVSTYRDPGIGDLPGVPHDVERICALLEPMGYTRILPELSVDPGGAELAQGIERWAAGADLGARDVVVVYFAGHGERPDDRHYLLCSTTEKGLWSTALPSEDLARSLVRSPVGHLLVILDTCYAAAGTGDIAVLANELALTQRGGAGRWLLAAARGKEKAKENAFVDALADVLGQPRAGAYQEFLGVREVTERVNAHFRGHHPHQHARHSTVDSDGQDPFFRNPAHVPDLPADDLDVATLTRLRRQHAGHFDPRGRGVEHAGEKGDYFTGRTAAFTELSGWLRADRHDRKARVVTGDPGSGKSALLGRFLALTDPDHPSRGPAAGTAADALPPAGLTVVPLHARRASAEELAADLADALHLPGADRDELLQALGQRTEPVTVLVDALDEAGTVGDATEGFRIARELLQPLTALPAVRLIVGTRRPLITALGRAVEVIDLDQPRYIRPGDVADYARDLLLDAHDPDSLSPYRDKRALAEVVATGIAGRAGTSFLVARMTARALVHGQITIDPDRPGWQQTLPSDAGQAFAAYLARFGAHRPKVERLMRPLAYAQGAGLPWSTLWAPLVEALSGVPCSQDDLQWLHEHAGAYIVEAATPAGSAYRLFHETMAEHLRTPGHDVDRHRAVTDALLALVPRDPSTGSRDWPAAHPYIRDHLATHAAAALALDALLQDADYLVHATPLPLSRAMRSARSPEARTVCAIYRTSADTHALAPPSARRDILAIDAARYNQPHLVAELTRLRSWQPRWATGALVHPSLRNTLTGHSSGVRAVAVATVESRPHAVTGGQDGTVRVWDLVDGTTLAALDDPTDEVEAVAVAMVDGRPHAVTGGDDGVVRVRDLTDGGHRATLEGHTDVVRAVAVAMVDGRPHAVTGGDDGTVRVWDLLDGSERAILEGHNGSVRAVAVADLDGRPHAVAAGQGGSVQVWDLLDGSERATLEGHGSGVSAVALAVIEGRPHAVTGGDDGTVRVWDLLDGSERATLDGHSDGVNTVAVATIDGRPHAVTGGDDTTVRVWDLTAGTPSATLRGHTLTVNVVTVAMIDDRPHAVTGSQDQTVRVWDLTEGAHRATLDGHADWVRAVAVTTVDGRPRVVTGSDDQTVRMWDLADGTLHSTLGDHRFWVRAVAVATLDGRPCAVTGSYVTGRPKVWDLTDGTLRATLTSGPYTDGIRAMTVATVDDRPHAVISCYTPEVPQVWDLTDGTFRAGLVGHDGGVRAVTAVTVDGTPCAVTGGVDHTVRVWDLTDHTLRSTLEGHETPVGAVATVTIDGRPHAVTGGDDHTVRVWDLTDDTHRATLTGHTDAVNVVAPMTIDGRPHAVTGSDDKTVRIWDLAVNRLVETIAMPLVVDGLATFGSDVVLGLRHEVLVLTLTGSAGASRTRRIAG